MFTYVPWIINYYLLPIYIHILYKMSVYKHYSQTFKVFRVYLVLWLRYYILISETIINFGQKHVIRTVPIVYWQFYGARNISLL